jgi:hypothetical protein
MHAGGRFFGRRYRGGRRLGRGRVLLVRLRLRALVGAGIGVGHRQYFIDSRLHLAEIGSGEFPNSTSRWCFVNRATARAALFRLPEPPVSRQLCHPVEYELSRGGGIVLLIGVGHRVRNNVHGAYLLFDLDANFLG